MTFQTSPLFEEYLSLLSEEAQRFRAPEHTVLSPEDCVLIIDMQNDFLPQDAKFNPHGGAFGVAEGNKCITPIVKMIKQAVEVGARIAATRDYHPNDHCSFSTEGGPFPAHCIQGSIGSKLVPDIAKALADAYNKQPSKVDIVFKAFHEDVDSFGGLPYTKSDTYPDAKANRIKAQEPGISEHCPLGCHAAPWTGSMLLMQSALQMAAEERSVTGEDINCPPDLLAMQEEGRRGRRTLHDLLRDCRRLFVCGLALDFCVLDTCINARANGFDNVYLVLDACRAAHIEKVGSFGTGFLSNPGEMLNSLRKASVTPTFTLAVIGQAAGLALGSLDTYEEAEAPAKIKSGDPFPNKFKALMLVEPKIEAGQGRLGVEYLAAQNQYKLEMVGDFKTLEELGWSEVGRCSPVGKLLQTWPDAPRGATKLCWAYPLADSNNVSRTPLSFLKLTTSQELAFAIRGGFLLLSEDNRVLKVQMCVPGRHLEFGRAQPLPQASLAALTRDQRLQDVTLPFLRKRGAEKFGWIHPSEQVGGERGPAQGAFAYLLQDGDAILFPVAAIVSRSQT